MELQRCPVCDGKRTIPIGESRSEWKWLGTPEHEPRARCAPCEGTGWVGGRAAELAFIEWAVQQEETEVAGLARLRAAGDALAGATALAVAGLVGWLMRARIDGEHDRADLMQQLAGRLDSALAAWEAATGPGAGAGGGGDGG